MTPNASLLSTNLSTSTTIFSSRKGMISSRRLFVGHLADTVDEYALIKFLSNKRKITKFDFLFHREGPKKGKPRGYAFVEYGTEEEAMETMLELHDKPLQGRKIVIKRANEAPEQNKVPSGGQGVWRTGGHSQRPTTLSLLKGHTKPGTRDSKINALEAKLAAMEAERQELEDETTGSASADLSVPPRSAIPDSLPRKPAADVIAAGEVTANVERDQHHRKGQAREAKKATLASLGSSLRD